jgi:hypothetical protein
VVLALLAALVAAACTQPPQVAAPPAEALRPPSARPAGRIAFRPRLSFSDGRSSLAGVAFLVEGPSPLAVASSHVVLAALKKTSLTKFELADASTRETVANAKGLAVPAGPPMDGYDFSTDFSIIMLDSMPAGATPLALATERAQIGDEVEVVACPADGSSPEIVMDGKVTVATATRIEVQFEPIGQVRGFSGAPILSRRTGRLVGILQTATAGGALALGRATPAESIVAKLAEARAATMPLALETWR